MTFLWLCWTRATHQKNSHTRGFDLSSHSYTFFYNLKTTNHRLQKNPKPSQFRNKTSKKKKEARGQKAYVRTNRAISIPPRVLNFLKKETADREISIFRCS